ncbi:MAG: GH36 C-terminal domain-containing protein, partial [Ruminococcus sp.]
TLQISRFKQYGPLIHNGRYYRLSNPMTEKYAVWEYVSEDQKEALVHGVVFHTEANWLQYRIQLRGLSPEQFYRLEGTDAVYSGKALMEGGILLPKTWGDYSPVELHLTAAEEAMGE